MWTMIVIEASPKSVRDASNLQLECFRRYVDRLIAPGRPIYRRRRTELESTKRAIPSLRQRGEYLQVGSNAIMLKQLGLRMLFLSLSMKIEIINSKLSETKYMDARCEIFHGVVDEVKGRNDLNLVDYKERVEVTLETMEALDGQTEAVMKVPER